MTKIEEIERAVASLEPKELEKFRAWFEEFDAEQFDRRIEQDTKSGLLDKAADEALADYANGRIRPL